MLVTKLATVDFFRPGEPTDCTFIESFNGSFFAKFWFGPDPAGERSAPLPRGERGGLHSGSALRLTLEPSRGIPHF